MISKPLSAGEKAKTTKDLGLISRLVAAGQDVGMRIIVFGGYGVDGFLGQITRPHHDVDVQIYGIEEDGSAVIQKLLVAAKFVSYEVEDKGKEDYYHNLVYTHEETVLDIYYLHTQSSPLGSEKYILKLDGTMEKQVFDTPILGKIGVHTFEVQNPKVELEDKVHKRNVRGDQMRPEHDQDIENLQNYISSRA